MNCQKSLQVYQSLNLDGGVYFGVLVVNWDDTEAQSVVLDFVVLGMAADYYFKCQVTDMWTGASLGTFKKSFFVGNVQPHDNAALKVKCLPWQAEDYEEDGLVEKKEEETQETDEDKDKAKYQEENQEKEHKKKDKKEKKDQKKGKNNKHDKKDKKDNKKDKKEKNEKKQKKEKKKNHDEKQFLEQ